MNEDFAEYHVAYSASEGALLTDRRLVLKLREVPVARFDAYKKFTKAVADDHELLISFSSEESWNDSYQNEIWDLPTSDNGEAARAYEQAAERYEKHDLDGEIVSLTRALELDPKFTRAWLWLGEIYKYKGQSEEALRCYRKALEIDPRRPVVYKALGYVTSSDAKIRRFHPGVARADENFTS